MQRKKFRIGKKEAKETESPVDETQLAAADGASEAAQAGSRRRRFGGKKRKKSKERVRREPTLRGDIAFLLIKVGILALLGFVMFGLVFGLVRTPDDTMRPAIQNGDLILYYRLQQDFQANDVIVVDVDGELEVRRIIAVEGDTVDIVPEGLEINGYVQDETSIYTETLPYAEGIEFPVKVGEDEYFVLGDYRTNTKDSRYYGCIRKDDIKGSVMTLLRRRNF